MSSLFVWLGSLFGMIIKSILHELMNEYRKPRKTKFIGDDQGVTDSISADIEADAIEYNNRESRRNA